MTLATSIETPSQTPSRISKVKDMADKTARMEKLNAAVKELAKEFGYQEALVEFKPFDDFKVQWVRSYKWIELDISDYLEDAPEEVVLSIARTILQKIANQESEYEPMAVEYLRTLHLSPHRQTFLRRAGISEDAMTISTFGRRKVQDDTLVLQADVSRIYRSCIFKVLVIPRDADTKEVLKALDAVEAGFMPEPAPLERESPYRGPGFYVRDEKGGKWMYLGDELDTDLVATLRRRPIWHCLETMVHDSIMTDMDEMGIDFIDNVLDYSSRREMEDVYAMDELRYAVEYREFLTCDGESVLFHARTEKAALRVIQDLEENE